jgi:hypothetical protein
VAQGRQPGKTAQKGRLIGLSSGVETPGRNRPPCTVHYELAR